MTTNRISSVAEELAVKPFTTKEIRALAYARAEATNLYTDCGPLDPYQFDGLYFFRDGSALSFDTSPDGVVSLSILSDRAAAISRNSAALM